MTATISRMRKTITIKEKNKWQILIDQSLMST